MFESPGAIAFNLGSISVHWYGILIGTGIVLAYLYAFFELRRRKLDIKPVDEMAFWIIIGGVIGARLYYVLFNLPYFVSHPLEIVQTWKGGLTIHGALIGGALVYFIYIFRRKLSWTLYADIIIPGILLAQAIGRWGNFFNNEAFGGPTTLPWKLYIPEAFRPESSVDFSYYHPTFLYESLWNFAGFAVLVFLSRKFYPNKNYPTGLVFFSYLIWYSCGRFFIESLRADSLYLGPFRAAQIASILLFLFGLIGLIFLNKRATIKGR